MPIIEPGERMQATIRWRNGNPMSFAPDIRMDLRNGLTWLEGPSTPSPEAPAGGVATVVARSIVLPDWDGRHIQIKLMADGREMQRYADWAKCLAQRFQWAGDGQYDIFFIPEWGVWAACGRRSLRHRGKSPGRVWAGFGIVPCTLEWEGWPPRAVFYCDDPNNFAYGSDIWKGGWSRWGDDYDWSSWYLQDANPEDPESWCALWPGGFDPHGFYAAVWIVQSESPIDRRNRGETPVTLVVGTTGSWDFIATDAGVFHAA